MRRSLLISLFVAALIPVSAQAKDSITIQSKIPFAKGLVVPSAVKTSCKLPENTATWVKKFASKDMKVTVAKNASKKTPGKVLLMSITNVVGAGGGAWSGAKSMTVKGTLYNNGKVIGSFTGSRHSGGGAFGGYKGTCSILGRCGKSIGKDVGAWLKSPSKNALLGDMK